LRQEEEIGRLLFGCKNTKKKDCLFPLDKPYFFVVYLHFGNFENDESVVSILETTANDGKTYDVREVPSVHDRFLLLDGTRLYTFGASFKDLGKKLFCFSLMESEAVVVAVKGIVDSYADFAE